MKINRLLTTVLPGTWWLFEKIEVHKKKSRARCDADVVDNIERLHRLKAHGAISEEEFQELKEKLKKQIGE